jgi:hypothetical protein
MLCVGRATARTPIVLIGIIRRAVARRHLNRSMAGNRARHAVMPPGRDARGCPPYTRVA